MSQVFAQLSIHPEYLRYRTKSDQSTEWLVDVVAEFIYESGASISLINNSDYFVLWYSNKNGPYSSDIQQSGEPRQEFDDSIGNYYKVYAELRMGDGYGPLLHSWQKV